MDSQASNNKNIDNIHRLDNVSNLTISMGLLKRCYLIGTSRKINLVNRIIFWYNLKALNKKGEFSSIDECYEKYKNYKYTSSNYHIVSFKRKLQELLDDGLIKRKDNGIYNLISYKNLFLKYELYTETKEKSWISWNKKNKIPGDKIKKWNYHAKISVDKLPHIKSYMIYYELSFNYKSQWNAIVRKGGTPYNKDDIDKAKDVGYIGIEKTLSKEDEKVNNLENYLVTQLFKKVSPVVKDWMLSRKCRNTIKKYSSNVNNMIEIGYRGVIRLLGLYSISSAYREIKKLVGLNLIKVASREVKLYMNIEQYCKRGFKMHDENAYIWNHIHINHLFCKENIFRSTKSKNPNGPFFYKMTNSIEFIKA